MPHELHRIVDFQILRTGVVRVVFMDATTRIIDLAPVLRGPLYGALADAAMFGKVALDPVAGTLTWPNGADFDPETLYHWSRYEEHLRERAESW